MRPLQNLSKQERAGTPLPFAKLLVRKVSKAFGVPVVAVLWVQRGTNYLRLGARVDLWDIERDARTYAGPWPIVAHPPCGPWGKLAWASRESVIDGIASIRLVHRFGGIVEQPLGSQLFAEHGRGGTVVRVNQCDHGHSALKPTLLYLVGMQWQSERKGR